MSSPRVIYSPRPDATPEAEVSALAGVYRFILEESCYAKKGGRLPDKSGLDDAKGKSKNDSRAKTSIP